ncbi:MAG: CAP domain-containing protein [Acidimicrobiia bacterium]
MTLVGLDTTAGADASSESDFLSKLNAERSAAGLAPLSVDGDLRSWARTHSQFMADGGCPDGKSICHSTSDQLKNAGGTGWSKIGENVGLGGTVQAIHDAFMNSSGHRANILDPDYNYVGIGSVHTGDSIYVTVVFMAKGGGSEGGGGTPTTQPQTSTTAPEPTTTTTLPPTTTTTLIVGPDKPVTPGESCLTVTRWWWMCHD